MSSIKNFLIRFLKRCWIPLAILVITMAVISSIFRALTPWATQYKPQVEQHLSVLLGRPVTISTMETGWYWFEPVIKLSQVNISKGTTDVVQLKKLLVGVNILSSLWHWQVQPGILYIEDLNVNLRQKDNHWQIDGLDNIDHPPVNFDEATYASFLDWILAQQKIVIKNLTTRIYLQNGTLIPIKQLNLMVVRNYSHFDIQGNAFLDQNPATSLQLLAGMSLDRAVPKNSKGRAFLSIDKFQISQWQQFFPQTRFAIKAGDGDVQLWMDWQKGKINAVQSRANLHHVMGEDKLLKKNYSINPLNANLAWSLLRNGWQLTADHINLGLGPQLWPENKMVLRYQNDNDTFFVYIQHLILESLMALAPNDLTSIKPLAEMNPRGNLTDTQIQFTGNSLSYLLTRFTQLSWSAQKKLPGIENLSGVLNWQPSEGQLELDGENTIIKLAAKPPVTFKEFNGAVEWKELSHGLHLSIDRFVINHPDLLISASGNIDDIAANSAGHTNLLAQVSAKNAQQWLAYLPSEYLKHKLDVWLKNDIKKIESLVAEVKLNGLASDFPFDKKPGEFVINGHVSGVNLFFNPHWPITKDIEAFVKVNQRLLEANIVHANLQETEVNNGNLRVEGIGLDHEILLIHTIVSAEAKKALAYVMASPLNVKLATLKMLQMEGPFKLDLQLEAPLYPENDEVLVLGDIAFNNNNVIVKHAFNDIQLSDLAGNLQFDQEGIMDSSLKAILLDYPVTLLIKSVRNANPYTEVKVQGKTTIDALREKYDLPIFSLMQGDLWLESLLTITDEPSDLDRLKIESSLNGLSIDMPPPFGKSANTKAPLTLNIEFNPDKAVRIQANYADRLSSDLLFSGSKGNLRLAKGQVYFGNNKPALQEKPGLHIAGTLPIVDLSQWQKMFKKLPDSATNHTIMDVVQSIDLLIKQVSIGVHNYPDLALKASKLPNKEWSIAINQQRIAGHLKYKPTDNYLSGTLTKLHIEDKNAADENLQASLSALKIQYMPTVDLSIDNFQVNQLNLGQAKIIATAFAHKWQINSFKIMTPFYQLYSRGQWVEKNKVNTTQVEAKLIIKDLAKTLEHWKISPVVEAHDGQLYFQGSWNGGIQNFSLKKLSGKMAISFEEGRITHLSPETESKIGLGKLLSILSLQTIPRRLKLDFSDLSSSGYSFDEFKGNFAISKGLMTTEDSYIDGPIAYASMRGNLDIARQLYDLDLRISPHVTASLPIVATIAGGPIAGLATWVVSKIINRGMQNISGYTYRISGPWKQPVVQQVSIIRKKKV